MVPLPLLSLNERNEDSAKATVPSRDSLFGPDFMEACAPNESDVDRELPVVRIKPPCAWAFHSVPSVTSASALPKSDAGAPAFCASAVEETPNAATRAREHEVRNVVVFTIIAPSNDQIKKPGWQI